MLSITQAQKYGIIYQLCWTAFQTSRFRNAEEKGHLTCFSKNIQVQNLFIFSYLIFSRTKEKRVSSRVKMHCICVLSVLLQKTQPQLNYKEGL